MTQKTKIIIAVLNGLIFTSLLWINVVRPNTINPVIIYISAFAIIAYNLIINHLDLRAASRENNQSEIARLKKFRLIFTVLICLMLIGLGMIFFSLL